MSTLGWQKLSAAMGSALPDPAGDVASASPVPPPSVANKPAPGQNGPTGTAPRTTYSRVNTGTPPTPDAGAGQQKTQSPRGFESLPKMAHQEIPMTTMMRRPTPQDLIKEAMEATANKLDLSGDGARRLVQSYTDPGHSKVASAQTRASSEYSTEYLDKLASGLDYMVKEIEKSASETPAPGTGPNALHVMTPTSNDAPIEPNSQGHMRHIPPMNPPTETSHVAKDPANAMATNHAMMHGEQPVDPINGGAKTASLHARNLAVMAKLANEMMPPGAMPPAAPPMPSAPPMPGVMGPAAPPPTPALTPEQIEMILALQAQQAQAGAPPQGPPPGEEEAAAEEEADEEAAAQDQAAKTAAAIDTLKNLGSKAKDAVVSGATKAKHAVKPPPGAMTVAGEKGMSNGKKALIGAGAAAGLGGLGVAASRKGEKTASPMDVYAALIEQRANELMGKQAADGGSDTVLSAPRAPATGATPPPGASASGEDVPSEPSRVSSQKGMIASNEAAINFTKRDAKAEPKKELARIIDEPPLSSATDKTLLKAFDHTTQAGAKIASARPTVAGITKTAAAQALIMKLAEAAENQKKTVAGKEKTSTGMTGLANPAGQSGFSASSMGDQ